MSPHRTANVALCIACACWGLSFPLEQALLLDQAHDFPGVSTWCLSAWGLCLRFILAALILALCCRRSLGRPSASEWKQGLGLGVLTAGGMLLQMDALLHAPASTVAFLSQCYAVWIPVFLALKRRRMPSAPVLLCILAVLSGVAVLSGIDLNHIALGRGELESLLGSLVFSGLILWTELDAFTANRTTLVTLISFAAAAVAFLPVVAATTSEPMTLVRLYADAARLAVLAVLAGVATCLGLLLMFRWQRHVGATAAAIIYCTEPIYASLFAFLLPAVLSAIFGISFVREELTISLIVGGGLILGAALVAQRRSLSHAVG